MRARWEEENVRDGVMQQLTNPATPPPLPGLSVGSVEERLGRGGRGQHCSHPNTKHVYGCSMSGRVCSNALLWPGLVLAMLSTFITTGTSLGLPPPTDDPLKVQEDAALDPGMDVDPAAWSDYLNNLFDPVFDPTVASNVSVVEKQTAHLVCRVNSLGTKTVSWIRHRDTHILTVGSFTYTSDERFSALHREGTNEWTLQIRQPTTRDTGLYECQVSTKPTRGFLIHLAVVVPQASILHSPEIHIDEGSALNLTCVVSPSPAAPEYIFWYHRGEVINYESEGSVRVTVRQESDQTVSTLLVARATMDHSGGYACSPSNTPPASVTVHVFKAEEPAAMHTSTGRRLPPPPPLASTATLISTLLLQGTWIT